MWRGVVEARKLAIELSNLKVIVSLRKAVSVHLCNNGPNWVHSRANGPEEIRAS